MLLLMSFNAKCKHTGSGQRLTLQNVDGLVGVTVSQLDTIWLNNLASCTLPDIPSGFDTGQIVSVCRFHLKEKISMKFICMPEYLCIIDVAMYPGYGCPMTAQ